MSTQKAVVVNRAGGPEVLEVVEVPKPERQQGEVLIRNVSTCVNPVDTYVRSGAYAPKEYPKVLGGDAAGEVIEVGEGSKFSVGDKVYVLTPWYVGTDSRGGYCQFVSVQEDWVAKVPDNLPLTEAGAVPLVGLTAVQAFSPIQGTSGKRVLITAAAGGVGHLAVQIAKAEGHFVVGTAGSANQEFLRELGCDETVDYTKENAAEMYKDNQFDIVVDCVGGPDAIKLAGIVKAGGTYSHILNRGTGEAGLDNIQQLAKESGIFVHTVLVQPSGQQLAYLSKLIGEGKVKVTIAASYPLEQAAEAHKQIETWRTRGKIVITI